MGSARTARRPCAPASGSALTPRPGEGRGATGSVSGRLLRSEAGNALRRAAAVLALVLAGCQVPPPEPWEVSAGHLGHEGQGDATPAPRVPESAPAAPGGSVPHPPPPTETYTVVVDQVPVEELLFALARDAEINVDVHPDISGRVTLNAVEQTLPQLLDRISHQVRLRYEMRADTLLILPDRPFLHVYKLDYVNVARDTTSDTRTSTAVAAPAGGTGGSASATRVNNVSNTRVWETLIAALREIVRPLPGLEGADPRETVIANPESGVIMVRARARQHDQVRAYLDAVTASLHRQVLIEATIVEVQLNDRFQAGVDWTGFAQDLGLTIESSASGGVTTPASGVTGLLLEYAGEGDGAEISVVARALDAFGDTRVLSSPRLMALNNQTAVLKVVDNEVYFSVEIKEEEDADTGDMTQEITSTVNTVPVGLVMNVTPQVSDADSVSLNIRPTITRIREFVNDPGVAIAAARLEPGAAAAAVNRVPVVQVRETETMMRVDSGQVAVLGGLMQERRTRTDDGVPGLSRLGFLAPLFGYRDRHFVKTELIIFLRATVIRAPSMEADFRDYHEFLPRGSEAPEPAPAHPGSSPGDPVS